MSNVCKHCKEPITHYDGRLWHSKNAVFPQYCWTDPVHGSRLHEPEKEIVSAGKSVVGNALK